VPISPVGDGEKRCITSAASRRQQEESPEITNLGKGDRRRYDTRSNSSKSSMSEELLAEVTTHGGGAETGALETRNECEGSKNGRMVFFWDSDRLEEQGERMGREWDWGWNRGIDLCTSIRGRGMRTLSM